MRGTLIIIAVFALAWEIIAGVMIAVGAGILGLVGAGGAPVHSLEYAGWFIATAPFGLAVLVIASQTYDVVIEKW